MPRGRRFGTSKITSQLPEENRFVGRTLETGKKVLLRPFYPRGLTCSIDYAPASTELYWGYGVAAAQNLATFPKKLQKTTFAFYHKTTWAYGMAPGRENSLVFGSGS